MTARGVRSAAALAAVLAAALYASLHESFDPVASRADLRGAAPSHDFTLAHAEPLVVEIDLELHADRPDRATIAVRVNGVTVDTIRPAAAFAIERRRVLLPASALRAGANRLEFAVAGDAPTVLAVRARVHNYLGIAPDFPRAAVVSDGAAWHRVARRSLPGHVLAFALLLGVCWAGVAVARRAGRRTGEARGGPWGLVAGPALVLAYSAATPAHVWLSPEAAAVVTLVPWAVAEGARAGWRARRRLAPPLAVAIVTIVSLEVALRFFNFVRPSFVFYAADASRFRGRPGTPHYDAVFNAKGFNDRERTYERPPDVRRRIVALGDSFAVGVVPRAQNYLALLEQRLDREQDTEVINLGVAGTTPADYLSMLVDEGLRYGPDVVLVTLYVGNDLETRRRRAYEYSFVAMLARAAWTLGRVPSTGEGAGAAGTYDDVAPSLSEARYLEIQVDRSWIYEGDRPPRLAGAVAETGRQVAVMRDLASRAGARFLVVIAPDEIQIDASVQSAVAAARGVPLSALDFEQPSRLVAADLAARGVAVLDLRPAFRDAVSRERLYKPRDTHWNLAGNALAASEIARALSR